MDTADPMPEGLSNDQIKTWSKQVLEDGLDEILQPVYDDDENRKRIIHEIIRMEKAPDDPQIDEPTKERINDFIAHTIRKAKEDFSAALSALKSHGSHAYFTITINMNGTNVRGVQQHRRDLIKIILGNLFGVVFCQELPGCFEKMIKDLTTENKWDFVKVEKEAAVIWDTTKFNGTKPTERSMMKIRDELSKKDTLASNLLSRAAFVKLTIVEDNTSFIAVSYHGEKNKIEEEVRYQIFDCLIEFVQQLSQEEGGLPFLIGGDFNFDTVTENSILDNISNITFPRYDMTDRANKSQKIPYKDNFCWHHKMAIKVSNIRPFVFGGGENHDLSRDESFEVENHPDAGQHTAKVDDLLDHDPIFGILTMPKKEEELTQNFQALSISTPKK